MVAAYLYVEGGGDSKALRSACREGFRKLLERAGLQGRMPRIVACGGRSEAFADFCTAVRQGESLCVLLVDAEAPITVNSAWDHVKTRPGDGWDKPDGVDDDQLHLMVQCMEAWFLADRPAINTFFGQGFQESALPAVTAVSENVAKTDLYARLTQATRNTKTKGTYGKGEHSFKLLATLDPALVRSASPWAERFFSALERLLP
jgi:hypothetical protein